jgi:hypothetical protein
MAANVILELSFFKCSLGSISLQNRRVSTIAEINLDVEVVKYSQMIIFAFG